MARVALVLSLVFSLFCSIATLAQTNLVGIPQASGTIPIPAGFVDPLTGQVHLEIPFASVPQRGAPPITAAQGERKVERYEKLRRWHKKYVPTRRVAKGLTWTGHAVQGFGLLKAINQGSKNFANCEQGSVSQSIGLHE